MALLNLAVQAGRRLARLAVEWETGETERGRAGTPLVVWLLAPFSLVDIPTTRWDSEG
jgi:hypothetical protein